MPLDLSQWSAVEHHRARGGPVDTGDRVEARGLAGPVGSDQAEDLPALDVERDRIECGEPTELHGQIGGLQQRLALGGLDVAVQGGQFLVDHRFAHTAAFDSSALLNSFRADVA